jgi:Dyp-type peroxidase family
MRARRDIQGNILRGYARHLHAAYLLTQITEPGAARDLIGRLLDQDRIATERDWGQPPETRINLALSRPGLDRLGVDTRPFERFPDFCQGMSARARDQLGDLGDNDPSHWPANLPEEIHLLFTVYGLTPDLRDHAAEELTHLLGDTGCVDRRSRRGEGVQRRRLRLAGEEWRNVRLGEFVLGHEDEDGVVPGGHDPMLLNGTFMVWRKLQQHVDAFEEWIRAHADGEEAQRSLRAQILGRWPNGDSLVRRPAGQDYGSEPGVLDERCHDLEINDFSYRDDPDGVRCPLGAHVRRANPRDALGFRTERTRRNRLIRRGMPYVDKDGTRGLVFVCFNASISRQFEQVQGNWLMGGDSFGLGAERDFLTAGVDPGQPSVRMTIQGDRTRPPAFLRRDRQFVTVHGGYYLFVPGCAALRRIADSR